MRKSQAQVSLPTWLPTLCTWLTGKDIPHPNGMPTSGASGGAGTVAEASAVGGTASTVSARTGAPRNKSARRAEDADLSTVCSVQYLTSPMWVHHRLWSYACLLSSDALRTPCSDRRLTFGRTRPTSHFATRFGFPWVRRTVVTTEHGGSVRVSLLDGQLLRADALARALTDSGYTVGGLHTLTASRVR